MDSGVGFVIRGVPASPNTHKSGASEEKLLLRGRGGGGVGVPSGPLGPFNNKGHILVDGQQQASGVGFTIMATPPQCPPGSRVRPLCMGGFG